LNNDWIFWGLKIAPIASKGSRDSLMASRAPPPGASEQDKLILKYLREKVDPVFVPMMRTIIQKVKEWDCGNRCVTPVQPGDWGVFFSSFHVQRHAPKKSDHHFQGIIHSPLPCSVSSSSIFLAPFPPPTNLPSPQRPDDVASFVLNYLQARQKKVVFGKRRCLLVLAAMPRS